MIWTLTMNPCLDRYLYVDEIKEDDTVRVKEVKDYPAGKGIDVSRVIKELGGVSAAVALLGGHTGERIMKMLQASGIIVIPIWIDLETRTNIMISTSSGHQYLFSLPGKILEVKKLEVVREFLGNFTNEGDVVVISGSLPRGVGSEFYTGLIYMLKLWGVRVYFDSDGERLKTGLDGEPYAIKPNVHELSRLLEKEVDPNDIDGIVKSANEIRRKYGVKEVLVSLGKNGAVALTEEGIYRGFNVDVPVKSAVGAGDSFLAAYVYHKEQLKKSAKEAFRWAMAAGNATAMTPGTELCHREDVERLYKEIRIEEIG